jgi:hypothetical protein
VSHSRWPGAEQVFGYAEAPFRATLQATFEFFDADRAATKLLFRDAYRQDNAFNKRLAGIYERFIGDIETSSSPPSNEAPW